MSDKPDFTVVSSNFFCFLANLDRTFRSDIGRFLQNAMLQNESNIFHPISMNLTLSYMGFFDYRTTRGGGQFGPRSFAHISRPHHFLVPLCSDYFMVETNLGPRDPMVPERGPGNKISDEMC